MRNWYWLGIFFMLLLFNETVTAKLLSVTIFVYEDKVNLLISLSVNTSKVNITSLIPDQCKIISITSSVPYSFVNKSILIINTSLTAYLVIKCECEYFLKDSKAIFIFNPKNTSFYNNFEVFILNTTPFISKYINLTKTDKYFYTFIDNFRSFEIIIYKKENLENKILFFFLFLTILYIVALFLRIIIKKKKLQEILHSIKNETERKIIEYLISKKGKCYQYEIVKELKLDKTTVSKALKRLETKGYIERKRKKNRVIVVLKFQP